MLVPSYRMWNSLPSKKNGSGWSKDVYWKFRTQYFFGVFSFISPLSNISIAMNIHSVPYTNMKQKLVLVMRV